MKTRKGFVSNSSSSSFILGLGKISNFEIFRKWLDSWKRSYDLGEIRVFGTSGLLSEVYSIPELDFEENNLKLTCEYSNSNKQVALPLDLLKEELIVVVDIHNDEGDGDYELTDCVYEGKTLKEDHFSEKQRELLVLGEKQGVSEYVSIFGCGRNG